MKKALITGVTGQDGSYLAEFLLHKGYEVHGIVRRASTFNTGRIDHIYVDPHNPKARFFLHYGDLSDAEQINNIVYNIRPDEVYNLGAQSHVRVSFDIPEYTANTTALGTTRLLETIRRSGRKIKLYQASSSEMFGAAKPPQSEKTVFQPRSPYACAKAYAYWMVKNYRDGYGIFASNGILFNHESLPKNSPVILKVNGLVDILPIEELFHKGGKHLYEGIKDEYREQLIWTGDVWTKIINGTAYIDRKKKLNFLQTREACVELTDGHYLFDECNREIKAEDVKVKDRLYKAGFPIVKNKLNDTDFDLAYFIGYMVGDGHIDPRGRIRLTGINKNEILNIGKIVMSKYGWTYRLKTWGAGSWKGCKNKVWQLDINNDSEWGLWIRRHIYTSSGEKKIPQFILNNNKKIKLDFFRGYYGADGRIGGHEKYRYKGWTTKSAVLNLGLNFLINELTGQKIKTKMEYRDGNRYYYTQLRSLMPANKGKHLIKDLNEVVKIRKTSNFNDKTFFDLQTKSQTFASGANLVKIHNSPRRGETFVSRKITRALANIIAGNQDKLYLGNLEAKRDWGFAPEYVEMMWLMLQQRKADDYVIGTGESHSVKEFVEKAFGYAGINIEWKGSGLKAKGIVESVDRSIERYKAIKKGGAIIEIDPHYLRPTEVDCLKADTLKAKKDLGWQPRVHFNDLVKIMVDYDMKLTGLKPRGEGIKISREKRFDYTNHDFSLFERIK